MELRRLRRSHQRGHPPRAARLAVVPRRLPGRRVAGPDRGAGRPGGAPGARHRRQHPALLERALSPSVRRALAWTRPGSGEVLPARNGQPERRGVRARSVRACNPSLGRDAERTAHQPGPGAGVSGEGTAMSTRKAAPRVTTTDTRAALRRQYGCGPVELTGSADALYERHLLFDNVADPAAAGARERYEAFARSVRDVLSQRWVRTEQTYERQNPKRVYSLSMEFLIGRSLANNVMNLLLDPLAKGVVAQHDLDWLGLLEQEPDAGLGNGGLGRLAACFLDSMATMQLPAMGYGLRYEYGMFRQSIEDGWQRERPDNWLRHPDPWEVARPEERVEIALNCSFEVRGGALHAIPGRPSTLIGMPFDRPVVGYGGKTINTLRLWAAAAHDYFDFQEFSHGDFVGALAETLGAESLTRVLYPDDSTTQGQGLRFVQEYFLVACSLADLVRRFRRSNDDWSALPDHVAIQLNDTHPTIAVPELMRILLDEAHLPWDRAWDLTRRTLAYTNHTLLPEP